MRHERTIREAVPRPLVDGFGRTANYLRLSVTDRCDLRCTYCMSENMTFQPRREILDLEELYRLSRIFMARGVRKIRITGGEPLVRKNIMALFAMLGAHLETGELDELTLTTNGTLLDRYAEALFAHGVRRVNVSLDTLDPGRYQAITRWGRIERVFAGLEAAQAAGLKVKINAVAMRGTFEEEVDDLICFAHGRDMDLTLIEEMPLGEGRHDRRESFLSLSKLRYTLSKRWTFQPLAVSSGGPARYVRVAETGGLLGFITPLSCDFCAACNRLRVSATGDLYTCMGNEGRIGLRDALRASEDDGPVDALISRAVAMKPEGHAFSITNTHVAGIARTMSVLGG
ncbi:GTP 3',8-cyclase MoaA [Martelella radicis]|uniref:GTP 3',8-cyclase n=1 Tax=Martelella radicis TaxID=1397476 RepID=A0A7W6KJD7_9HYPH|nr:GTP 3',8-cyclase MoaA [Martelella radicis]MBB4122085.1 cyclic pyranopterin phosphate synthase [Martelella radicis]